jgi:hypothetical protein
MAPIVTPPIFAFDLSLAFERQIGEGLLILAAAGRPASAELAEVAS